MMSHEQFWTWLVQMAMAVLGWSADAAREANLSDIMLGLEGKAAIAPKDSNEDFDE